MFMAVLGILLGLLFVIVSMHRFFIQGYADVLPASFLGLIFIGYGIRKIMTRNDVWLKLKNKK